VVFGVGAVVLATLILPVITWGKVVGFAGGDILLEDKDGNLRQVETYGKGSDFPRIKVNMTRN
jgi:hypothetical protein